MLVLDIEDNVAVNNKSPSPPGVLTSEIFSMSDGGDCCEKSKVREGDRECKGGRGGCILN